MNNYEIMFIVKGSMVEADANKVAENQEEKIKSYKGKVEKTDKWGKRKFAYKIGNMTDGFYFLSNFSVDPLKLNELVGDIKIIDNVVRYLVIKLPEKAQKEKKA